VGLDKMQTLFTSINTQEVQKNLLAALMNKK